MCGIGGLLGVNDTNRACAIKIFQAIRRKIRRRGPDAEGVSLIFEGQSGQDFATVQNPDAIGLYNFKALFYNARGIPPTENARLTQPVVTNTHVLIHNGQLSNDRIWLDKHPDLPKLDSAAFLAVLREEPNVCDALNLLDGSRALAIYNLESQSLLLARDYLGLHIAIIAYKGNKFLAFSSEPLELNFLTFDMQINEWELPAYHTMIFKPINDQGDYFAEALNTTESMANLRCSAVEWQRSSNTNLNSAVVVLSGGMDSTVAATWAVHKFKQVRLLHFKYGARAQAAEEKAVKEISHWLKDHDCEISLEFIDLDFIKRLGGSSLTDHSQSVVEGELAVEKATEWVPARNLAMVGLAASYCDRHDIGNIVLGLNGGEGNVFADNSKEFYYRMTAAMELGTHSRPHMAMPLGNMQKRHIYGYGKKIGAPLHLAWSCYHSSGVHCGRCGPCLQRKWAAMANYQPNDLSSTQHYDCVVYEDPSIDEQSVIKMPKDFDYDALIED